MRDAASDSARIGWMKTAPRNAVHSAMSRASDVDDDRKLCGARAVALALRVAEYRLLEEKHAEPPVLLVDDFTAELDAGRRAFLLDLTSRTPQALVSGTEPPPRADLTLHVDGGEVRRA